jgi:hypothetical protein
MARWDAKDSRSHQQVSEATYHAIWKRGRVSLDTGIPLLAETLTEPISTLLELGPGEHLRILVSLGLGLHAAALEVERAWVIPGKIHPAIAWSLERMLADVPEKEIHFHVLYAAQVGHWAGRTGESPRVVLDRVRAWL